MESQASLPFLPSVSVCLSVSLLVVAVETIKTEADQEVCDKEKPGPRLTYNLSLGLSNLLLQGLPSTESGSRFTTKSESTISNLDTGFGIQARVALGS